MYYKFLSCYESSFQEEDKILLELNRFGTFSIVFLNNVILPLNGYLLQVNTRSNH